MQQVLAEAITASAVPVRLARSASYAHLTMVAGVVAAAAGDELVIAHPLGHSPRAWIAVILGGPAQHLAGIRCRVTRPHIGLLARAGVMPGWRLSVDVVRMRVGGVCGWSQRVMVRQHADRRHSD